MNKPNELYINPKSFVTYKELESILKISRCTILKLMKAGKFPKPVEFLKRKNGITYKKYWVYQDIMDVIDNIKSNITEFYNEKPSRVFRETNIQGEEQSERMRKNLKRRYGQSSI